MTVIGIVCEYNPFHKGHLFHIRESRRVFPDAAVVSVMSGDFVQRGEAAIFSKYARAEAACRCGADLVLELPLPWALSSAEGFATGAVALLHAAGADRLSFGSESGKTAEIQQLAAFLQEENTLSAIRERLDREPTLSFAAAREAYVREKLGDCAALLHQPNDILAVEYLKAIRILGASMKPLAVKRRGAAHDSLEAAEYPSASRLRSLLREGAEIGGWLPAEAETVFSREIREGRTQRQAHLELAVLSRLRMLEEGDFQMLPDASDGAGTRLWKAARRAESLEEIVQLAATKRYTAARMRRMCLCACLGVRPDDREKLPSYARVLAFSEKGKELLRGMRQAAIPPLLKPAAVRELGPDAERVFSLSAQAHDFYVLGFDAGERHCGEDWRRGPFILPNR